MKKPNIAIVLFFVIAGCMDQVSNARLQNDSGGAIEVLIFFNRDFFSRHYKDSSAYYGLTRRLSVYPEKHLVSLDSSRLMGIYKVPANSDMMIYHDTGPKPDLAYIDSIGINANGATTVYSKDQVLSALKYESKYWNWHIR